MTIYPNVAQTSVCAPARRLKSLPRLLCATLQRSMGEFFYVRNLPHWVPPGEVLFVTWRLHGSLPQAAGEKLLRRKDPNAGRAFARMDRVLDRAFSGPRWLAELRIAELISETLESGEHTWKWYELFAFVVMPNHVHALLRPLVRPARIMQRVKGSSAQAANAVLGRTGLSFWQDESYDHWVRNSTEFDRIKAYIESNPVRAGLARTAEDWPWSSAALGRRQRIKVGL